MEQKSYSSNCYYLPKYYNFKTKFSNINEVIRPVFHFLFFNRDLNRGCLVYMFSLRFSGSKYLINLWRQFRERKICSCT